MTHGTSHSGVARSIQNTIGLDRVRHLAADGFCFSRRKRRM
jgi:hypothetical protein